MTDKIIMQKHFVTFFAPGTFVPETQTDDVETWDIDAAVKAAGKVTMRYGARPYALKFFTMGRGEKDLNSKQIAESNIYYLGGTLRTLKHVEADNDPKEDILRSNMRMNHIARVITNDNSWRFTGEFKDGDVLLDVKLPALPKQKKTA